jgi:hypothetical protein
VESRKLREPVLRTVGVFSNYDYAFHWIFQQNGRIRVRVGATGMDNVMSAKNPTAEDATGESSRYGRFIAENTVGVDHDYFFPFRLHFDLDGTAVRGGRLPDAKQGRTWKSYRVPQHNVPCSRSLDWPWSRPAISPHAARGRLAGDADGVARIRAAAS